MYDPEILENRNPKWADAKFTWPRSVGSSPMQLVYAKTRFENY